MKSNINYLYALAIIVIELLSCAHPMTPGGGPKDQTAPVLKRTSIERNNKNQVKRIELSFNENINLLNADDNLFINPVPQDKPSISYNKKTLVIKFNEPLNQETNYTLNLNEGLADLNENNVGSYPSINIINTPQNDTNYLSGNLQFIQKENNNSAKLLAILTSKKTGQNYLSKIKNDSFFFYNIPSGNYDIKLFEDINNNKKAEENEIVSINQNITSNQNLDNVMVYFKVKQKLIVNTFTNIKQLSGLQKHIMLQELKQPGTFVVSDTLYYNNLLTSIDSIKFNNSFYVIQNNNIKSEKEFIPTINKKLNINDSSLLFQVILNNKKQSINDLKIHSLNDSNKLYNYEIVEKLTVNNNDIYQIKIKELPVASYIIELHSKTDTTRKYHLKNVFSPEKRGTAIITNINSDNYKILIIDNNKPIAIKEATKGIENKIYLNEGKYKLIIFEDKNNNHIIDPPLTTNNFNAEKIIIIKESFQVLKNIENTLVLK